ncbi:MAG: hypothetical protein Q4A30_00385 [Candidatus Saccharibacteria bacterium]|nr:hypothetical protein [Candidatus Saccharibacteria bacterium]
MENKELVGSKEVNPGSAAWEGLNKKVSFGSLEQNKIHEQRELKDTEKVLSRLEELGLNQELLNNKSFHERISETLAKYSPKDGEGLFNDRIENTEKGFSAKFTNRLNNDKYNLNLEVIDGNLKVSEGELSEESQRKTVEGEPQTSNFLLQKGRITEYKMDKSLLMIDRKDYYGGQYTELGNFNKETKNTFSHSLTETKILIDEEGKELSKEVIDYGIEQTEAKILARELFPDGYASGDNVIRFQESLENRHSTRVTRKDDQTAEVFFFGKGEPNDGLKVENVPISDEYGVDRLNIPSAALANQKKLALEELKRQRGEI